MKVNDLTEILSSYEGELDVQVLVRDGLGRENQHPVISISERYELGESNELEVELGALNIHIGAP